MNNNDKDEPNLIELEDGNAIQIVVKQNVRKPSPKDVFNEIVAFGGILKNATETFEGEMCNMLVLIKTSIINFIPLSMHYILCHTAQSNLMNVLSLICLFQKLKFWILF